MQDLIAGRLDYIAEQIPTALTQIRGDKVKAIATLGLTRAPGLENLPTAEEEGLKGLDCNSWGAFVFPRGTPDAIVRKLAKATSDALDSPAVRERYEQLGVTVVARDRRSPEFLAKYIPEEFKRWSVPIKASGFSID
jgi:tripartite-type tricarboxylate transporter receptor subunit TctC